MSDFNLTDLLLTWLINYGALAFGVALFLGAVGIPLPGSLLVLAAGAFVRQGVLDGTTASLFGLVGAVLGDISSYGLGYFARQWVQHRFMEWTSWQAAQATFAQHGGVAVYLTRFILTQVAIPINLIAGSSGYPFQRFVMFDIAGEITWLILYGGLGYAFGNQWELINQFISDFSGLLIGIIILAVGIYLIYRRPRWSPFLYQQQEKAISSSSTH